ncbi:hypothetical protein [Actinoplanes sp. HUAS TT8]|uniref:hypothetical protein n=1 Tax=Actinoplanes sp. HUAS TT8 TaxID=3447453 RepID=UPI003F524ADB
MSSLTSGFRRSWAARRPLAGVLLLVVTAYLLTASLLDLFADDHGLVILDGNPRPDEPMLARALVAATLWLGGLVAAGRVTPRTGRISAGAFLLSALVAPILLAVLRNAAGTVPYADRLLDALLLAGVLAVQAGVVASRPGEVPAEQPGRLWPSVATGIALVLTVGVAVQNPYEAPVIRTGRGTGSEPVAAAWPDGQHPVIVTTGGIRFCDDDLCRSFHGVTGLPVAMDGYGSVAIGSDGTVVKSVTTGGLDTGGPFVQFARCGRDGCRTAYFPIRTSADDRPDLTANPEVAGAPAPDGALWFFLATPVTGGENGRYRLELIRCAEVTCASPDRHPLGEIDRTPADGYPDLRRARLTVGSDGRPSATFWIGHEVARYTCDPVGCANPRLLEEPVVGTAWATSGRRTISLMGNEIWDGTRRWQLDGAGNDDSGTVLVRDDAVYVAGALSTGPEPGIRVTIGTPPGFQREVVWRCTSSDDCDRVALDVYPGAGRRELLAVSRDGRVLVIRDDHTVLAKF